MRSGWEQVWKIVPDQEHTNGCKRNNAKENGKKSVAPVKTVVHWFIMARGPKGNRKGHPTPQDPGQFTVLSSQFAALQSQVPNPNSLFSVPRSPLLRIECFRIHKSFASRNFLPQNISIAVSRTIWARQAAFHQASIRPRNRSR